MKCCIWWWYVESNDDTLKDGYGVKLMKVVKGGNGDNMYEEWCEVDEETL